MKIYEMIILILLEVNLITFNRIKVRYVEIRLGLILEELDTMAGTVAYKHAIASAEVHEKAAQLLATKHYISLNDLANLNIQIPLVIVTAAWNRIELLKKLDIQADLVLEGFANI
jgi:hypothetical protein